MRKRTACRAGFTLIELLTVIAIIAILASILVPSVASTREKGRIAYCMANLSQVGKALNLYADANKDYLPVMRQAGGAPMSWAVSIRDYMNNDNKVFLCPSDTLAGSGNRRTYSANGYVGLTTNVCPFSNLDESKPMRLSDLDYNKGDLILVSERPGLTSANRGLMENDSFTTLNRCEWYGTAEEDLLPHRPARSLNYLMASMAVKTMKTVDVQGPQAKGNLFTVFR